MTHEDMYSRINLIQGTEEWLAWREQGIGSSDAPAVMGENPWKSPERLMKEKVEGCRVPATAAMSRGIVLEPEARRAYEMTVGVEVPPACLQSTRYEWLRASVDGLAGDGSLVVEIKCGERAHQHSFETGEVPDYYYGQLQHILAVTGLESIDFWCYLPDRPEVHLCVERDDPYIERMLEEEFRFWQRLQKMRE
jgi:putative phage-type endonuclease